MQKRALNSAKNAPDGLRRQAATISVGDLSYFADGWLLDGEIRKHSPHTIALRRLILNNLLWFLEREEFSCCGTTELRGFLAYLVNGHTSPGGRWGNPKMVKPVRPRTVETYQGHLKTFFSWMLDEGALEASPMQRMRPPVCRADQVQPFTTDQIKALLLATRRTWYPARNQCVIRLLFDTGVRADELCRLTRADLDLNERRITVLGKGNKKRSVYFGKQTTKALWAYLRDAGLEAAAPLFASERGGRKAEHMTPHGLGDMVERLGKAGGVVGVRCSPHTFRHTFAVEFLRVGGQAFALREILGHTDLKMKMKYVQFVEADIAGQRRYSPGDRL